MNTLAKPNASATERTLGRYQRLSPMYDRLEGMAERRYGPWRRRSWFQVGGINIFEVGVGIGKNIPYGLPDLIINSNCLDTCLAGMHPE